MEGGSDGGPHYGASPVALNEQEYILGEQIVLGSKKMTSSSRKNGVLLKRFGKWQKS